MTRLSDHVHHLRVESELVSKVLHHVLHRGVALDAAGGPHVRVARLVSQNSDGINRPGLAEIRYIVLSMLRISFSSQF